jgi:hypothetical protein
MQNNITTYLLIRKNVSELSDGFSTDMIVNAILYSIPRHKVRLYMIIHTMITCYELMKNLTPNEAAKCVVNTLVRLWICFLHFKYVCKECKCD